MVVDLELAHKKNDFEDMTEQSARKQKRKRPGAAFVPIDNLRYIRRYELQQIVPLCDTAVWEMEHRGEFPRRVYLSPRCVAWKYSEIEAWLDQRRRDSHEGRVGPIQPPRRCEP